MGRTPDFNIQLAQLAVLPVLARDIVHAAYWPRDGAAAIGRRLSQGFSYTSGSVFYNLTYASGHAITARTAGGSTA